MNTVLKIFFLAATTFTSVVCLTQQKTFEYTGEYQRYVVPNGVYSLQVDLYGASGGWNDYSGVKYEEYTPGKGGRVQATIPVHPGQTLYIFVGGKGGDGSNASGGIAGYNGGGSGNTSGIYSGGGGGGATDIRIDGVELEKRIIVAGGGGGAAYNYADGGDDGGHGGDVIGQDGFSNHLQQDESRGRGATQENGGIGGQWSGYEKAGDGTLGIGGNGPAGTCGTGGGGGYYGGGGGCWSGGGGGSSFAFKKASQVKHEQGVNDGNGKVIIRTGGGNYSPDIICTNPIVKLSGNTTLCEGETFTFSAVSNYRGTLSWDHGVINNVPFTPPVGRTTYTVTSSDNREYTYSVELNVLSRNLKATTTNGIICEGETTILYGQGAENYMWDKGVQNGVPFSPPVGVNSYTVRSYDAGSQNQCSNEASVFVVVNKVSATAEVKEATYNQSGSVNLTPAGGTYPYSYFWTKDGMEIGRSEDLINVSSGTYEVLIVDAIGCSSKQSFTVGSNIGITQGGGLKAEMSSDQIYLNITYSGLFDYKILNSIGEIVITGTVHNAGKIDVSRLPSGNYRICSLNNSNSENVNFVKW